MLVRHDAFARGGLDRHTWRGTDMHCAWCGQERKRLYTYVWLSDGSQALYFRHIKVQTAFCNLQCYDAFHGN